MKNPVLLLLIPFALIVFGCSSDDDNPQEVVQNITAQALTNTLHIGSWRVTYFQRNGADYTHEFNNFDFTFLEDQSIGATDGSVTREGVWSVIENGGNSPEINPYLNLNFGAPEIFSALNESWYPIERTGNLIRLRHLDDEDANAPTDYLTLERNQ